LLSDLIQSIVAYLQAGFVQVFSANNKPLVPSYGTRGWSMTRGGLVVRYDWPLTRDRQQDAVDRIFDRYDQVVHRVFDSG
ncbi:MAG: hypothetical protein K0R75_2729, partial [Paenibacillaceae bacterium]|nr:hypothetical protein [Paenibacillaceae bacterium]